MQPNAILFDLDGTLLPMPDQEVFLKAYMKALAGKIAPLGYEPKMLIDTVLKGTGVVIANNGQETNETVFWRFFCSVFGENWRLKG